MEFPVSGRISIGAFHASSEDDLVALYQHVLDTYGLEYALEIGDLFPEVFVKTYNLMLTQEQLDMIHLLLGHVSSSQAFELDRKITEFVSDEALENYERVSFNFDSEDGLNIRIN